MNLRKIGCLLFIFCFMPPCARIFAAAPPLKVVFMPQGFPQAQFAGYYVAREKGIYARYGLDVEIKHTISPHKNNVDCLLAQKADFITDFLSHAMKMRSRGVPVVNIAQIIQRSPLMIVARKNSGITSLRDFNNKKIGIGLPDFESEIRAFLNRENINAEIIPTGGSEFFLRGCVDAIAVMWYNEYYQLLDAGLSQNELSVFFLYDYNLNIPEDGLYCLEDTLEKNPEKCKAFVLASLEGWQSAFADEQGTLAIIKKYMEMSPVSYNESLQQWMLRCMKDVILPPGAELGNLSPKDFKNTAKTLLAAGELENIPSYTVFYRKLLK